MFITMRALRRCAPVVLACAFAFASLFPGPLHAETYVFNKNIEISDLPKGLERRIPTGASAEEIGALLRGQASLTLDGAVLNVTPPRAGSSRSLAVQKLELRNGASIVTNGVNLEIYAQTIQSNGGAIVSFTAQGKSVAGIPPPGSSGASGLSAGTVVLFGKLQGSDVLVVSLPGQDGQSGGVGLKGPTGAQGPNGSNGSDHLFDCARGGGNGGNGARGGDGGRGGTGGSGGSGGRLILRGEIAGQRLQVDFSADGGRKGTGGVGGPGGDGGAGGRGGSGTVYCRGGSNGNSGPPGQEGEAGVSGVDGDRGAIVAD